MYKIIFLFSLLIVLTLGGCASQRTDPSLDYCGICNGVGSQYRQFPSSLDQNERYEKCSYCDGKGNIPTTKDKEGENAKPEKEERD